jgi:hypothetical protein
MVSRILRVFMVLLIIFTVVEEAAAKTCRRVDSRGRIHVGTCSTARSHVRGPGFSINFGGGSNLGRGFRSRSGRAAPHITNIDRSRHVTNDRSQHFNSGAQVDDATSDDDNSDDDDSGNDDSDSDGDAGGSDDGGDD